MLSCLCTLPAADCLLESLVTSVYVLCGDKGSVYQTHVPVLKSGSTTNRPFASFPKPVAFFIHLANADLGEKQSVSVSPIQLPSLSVCQNSVGTVASSHFVNGQQRTGDCKVHFIWSLKTLFSHFSHIPSVNCFMPSPLRTEMNVRRCPERVISVVYVE